MSHPSVRPTIAAALALLATSCRTADPDAAPDRWPPSVAVDGATADPAAGAGSATAGRTVANNPAGGIAPSAAVSDGVGLSATAPSTAPDGAAAPGGMVAATCDMLEAGGDLATATGVYVGLVIPAVKGEPVGGRVMALDDAQRRTLRAALRDLKDDAGRFCGVVDDPGGWE